MNQKFKNFGSGQVKKRRLLMEEEAFCFVGFVWENVEFAFQEGVLLALCNGMYAWGFRLGLRNAFRI